MSWTRGKSQSGRLNNAALSIFYNVALPMARHSAEVAYTAKWWPTTGLFSEWDFFFPVRVKHYNVLDTDSYILEGYNLGRFACVLMCLHRSGPLPAKTGNAAWNYPGNLNCLWFMSSAGQPRSACQRAWFMLAWWALGENYDRKRGWISDLPETLARGPQT